MTFRRCSVLPARSGRPRTRSDTRRSLESCGSVRNSGREARSHEADPWNCQQQPSYRPWRPFCRSFLLTASHSNGKSSPTAATRWTCSATTSCGFRPRGFIPERERAIDEERRQFAPIRGLVFRFWDSTPVSVVPCPSTNSTRSRQVPHRWAPLAPPRPGRQPPPRACSPEPPSRRQPATGRNLGSGHASLDLV